MVQFAAYLYDKDFDTYEMKAPFLVHSCGKITFNKNVNLRIDRKNGRKDYQIIYVNRGKGHFWFGEEKVVLDEGYVVLYHPDERQRYSFYFNENAEFYWLHFGGRGVSEILKQSGLEKMSYVGMSPQITRGFEELIRELMMKKKEYIRIANLKGEELVWLFTRENYEQLYHEDKLHQRELEKIIEKMNFSYADNLTVEELAKEYGASVEWFIKSFKNYTGTTPKQYINEIRLNHARELLESMDDHISEISRACGFENPLYFSRYFQKKYHVSPSDYRKEKHTRIEEK